jgi:hypothetical protein
MTNEQLAVELDRLGVCYVRCAAPADATAPMHPAKLLAGLAMSDEARLRLALIPLLLMHPELGSAARAAGQDIPPKARIVLECYYTAAVYLQQKYAEKLAAAHGLRGRLTHLFSRELGIQVGDDPGANLAALAQRQALLSGDAINWAGTYEHAIRALIPTAEREAVWAR